MMQCNISSSYYIYTSDAETYCPMAELKAIEAGANEADAALKGILSRGWVIVIGISSLFML